MFGARHPNRHYRQFRRVGGLVFGAYINGFSVRTHKASNTVCTRVFTVSGFAFRNNRAFALHFSLLRCLFGTTRRGLALEMSLA